MNQETPDILILGGGPGGLSTALHLIRIDPRLTSRILILEKEHYPRHKLCAGGLVVDAEVILERLGLDVQSIPHADASVIHFDFAGKGLGVRNPKQHALRTIRRNEFDHWLAEEAQRRGIKILQGVQVEKVTAGGHQVIVETRQGNYHASIVVGADGSRGITRRCVLPQDPVYTARVLEVITAGYPDSSPRDNAAYFDFFPVPQNIAGYTWDFPARINGKAMRCWGIYDSNVLGDLARPPLKDLLAKEMERGGFELSAHSIEGHPIRWYSPWNKISVPRVLLVGDAAGADPIFGEGISMALGYGAIAAQEIAHSLQRGEFSFQGYKQRLARSGLGQTLLARWIIAQILYAFKWQWFQFLLWRFLQPVVLLFAWVFVLNWSRRMPLPVSKKVTP